MTRFILCAIVLVYGLVVRPSLASAEPPDGYKLVWSDEFDGKSVDTDKWTFRLDSIKNSTQKQENVSVRDGALRIALKAERAGNKNYTGGGVISKREFIYGYYESRFKLPATRGWHTSFWMSSTGTDEKHVRIGGAGPHELDVCEHESYKRDEYKRSLWMRKPKSGSGLKPIGTWKAIHTPDLTTDFHTWGCEFTPTTLVYYFDGKEIERWDVSGYEHGKQRILLTSIAAKFGANGKTGDPVDAELPAYADFDYVRFYEKK
ncbi:MAG: family 16 glycosylhydrolase [Phycisphaerae bacterium]|nr:glycoside hydrolase family 16 protein [Tepidisphaeraceae bacterium]